MTIPKVFKQGSADCLCGFYAVMNAVNYLTNKFSERDKKSDKFFEKMIKAHKRFFPDALYEGIDWWEILQVAKWAARKNNLNLSFVPEEQIILTKDVYLDFLAATLQEGTVAVIGVLSGAHIKMDHWLCISKVTRTHVHLIDSSYEPTVVARTDVDLTSCTTDKDFVRIDPSETIIFSKR
jgi:hypothetical protein